MSVERTLRMSEEFHNLAQDTIARAFENAARAVHIQVFYHRPDSPSLVQEFCWGTEDMFIPAVKLIDMVKDTRTAFERASGAFGIEQAIQQMQDMMDAVQRDIAESQSLPPEFSMSFKDRPHWEQGIMIADVPFQRMQNLLRHWHENLSSPESQEGALNYVKITHEPLPQNDHFGRYAPRPSNTVSSGPRVFH